MEGGELALQCNYVCHVSQGPRFRSFLALECFACKTFVIIDQLFKYSLSFVLNNFFYDVVIKFKVSPEVEISICIFQIEIWDFIPNICLIVKVCRPGRFRPETVSNRSDILGENYKTPCQHPDISPARDVGKKRISGIRTCQMWLPSHFVILAEILKSLCAPTKLD